ncbi:hypothetical protein F4604DRAFT_1674512 [Suillus subluteus]|nr:hypothetical protein F4604DRAFT_1674512 [Suillus subluteus]
MTRADYNGLKASTGGPQQGVEQPSVSHALATAFTLNDRHSLPSLSLKRMEREHECPFPAQYHALNLDIQEPPRYLLHCDSIQQSSTHLLQDGPLPQLTIDPSLLGPVVRRPPGILALQEAPEILDEVPGKAQRNVWIRYCTGKSKPKKRRVFIGTPLPKWKIHKIKDLKPSAVIPPLVSGENRTKGKAVERLRVYIGDARWLHVPYTHMPV